MIEDSRWNNLVLLVSSAAVAGLFAGAVALTWLNRGASDLDAVRVAMFSRDLYR